jgi:hypothetical protein
MVGVLSLYGTLPIILSIGKKAIPDRGKKRMTQILGLSTNAMTCHLHTKTAGDKVRFDLPLPHGQGQLLSALIDATDNIGKLGGDSIRCKQLENYLDMTGMVNDDLKVAILIIDGIAGALEHPNSIFEFVNQEPQH